MPSASHCSLLRQAGQHTAPSWWRIATASAFICKQCQCNCSGQRTNQTSQQGAARPSEELQHNAVQVRLEFLYMVGDWMLKLRERIDHHSRLMPYALSALSDPSPAVQQAALQILDDLGAQWEEEHKDDLKVGDAVLLCCASAAVILECLL